MKNNTSCVVRLNINKYIGLLAGRKKYQTPTWTREFVHEQSQLGNGNYGRTS